VSNFSKPALKSASKPIVEITPSKKSKAIKQKYHSIVANIDTKADNHITTMYE